MAPHTHHTDDAISTWEVDGVQFWGTVAALWCFLSDLPIFDLAFYNTGQTFQANQPARLLGILPVILTANPHLASSIFIYVSDLHL